MSTISSLPVINRLNYPARIANGHAVVGHVAGHHAACSDNAVAPDCHPGQHYYAAAELCAVAYLHGLCVCKAKLAAVRTVVGQHPFGVAGGVRGGVYLHIRGYEHVVVYFDDVVVNEGAVHVDYYAVAYEDVAAVLAVEVDVYMHAPPHAAEQLAHDVALPVYVRIGCFVKLARQAFSLRRNLGDFRVATEERLSGEAFFKFGLHFQLMIIIAFNQRMDDRELKFMVTCKAFDNANIGDYGGNGCR